MPYMAPMPDKSEARPNVPVSLVRLPSLKTRKVSVFSAAAVAGGRLDRGLSVSVGSITAMRRLRSRLGMTSPSMTSGPWMP